MEGGGVMWSGVVVVELWAYKLGFRTRNLKFEFGILYFGFHDSQFKIYDSCLWFKIYDLGLGIQNCGFRIYDLGFRIQDLVTNISMLEFGNWNLPF